MKDQDWERESLKDFIYLQEEMELLKQEIMEEINIRKAAKIVVINEDKIHANEYIVSKVSPTT
jgi:hypothetical protein